MAILNFIVGLGPSVMMPILLTIIGIPPFPQCTRFFYLLSIGIQEKLTVIVNLFLR